MDPKTEPNVNEPLEENLNLADVEALLEGDWPGIASADPAAIPAVDPDKPADSDAAPPADPDAPPVAEPDKIEPAAEPKTEPAPATAEPKLYKYRGKEYTAEELVAQGLLEDALTSAEQMPHYQKKYETLLEQQRGTPTDPAQPAAAQQPSITPEQVLTHYTPHMEQAVSEGWIEPEMTTVFPKFTANMMYYRETIQQLTQMVGVLAQRERQRVLEGLRTRVDGFIENTCQTLANKAKIDPMARHFELLGDDKVRGAFREHIYKMDPKVEAVNEDFIKTQWLAYNSDALLEALRSSNSQVKEEQDQKRRLAKGEGAGNPRGATPKVEKTEIDVLLGGDFPSGG